MDYRQLFAHVAERPRAYGLDGSFAQFVVFVNGCDAGNDWGLLVGLPEWLAMRSGVESDEGWVAGVRRLAEQRADAGPVTDEMLVAQLATSLDGFLADRFGVYGPASILRRHVAWKLRES